MAGSGRPTPDRTESSRLTRAALRLIQPPSRIQSCYKSIHIEPPRGAKVTRVTAYEPTRTGR